MNVSLSMKNIHYTERPFKMKHRLNEMALSEVILLKYKFSDSHSCESSDWSPYRLQQCTFGGVYLYTSQMSVTNCKTTYSAKTQENIIYISSYSDSSSYFKSDYCHSSAACHIYLNVISFPLPKFIIWRAGSCPTVTYKIKHVLYRHLFYN